MCGCRSRWWLRISRSTYLVICGREGSRARQQHLSAWAPAAQLLRLRACFLCIALGTPSAHLGAARQPQAAWL